MVAIVGGAELGLGTTSGRVLGDKGQTGSAPQGRAGEGVTVNAVTGNLIIQRQDEVLVGKGLDIGIERTYNSLGQLNDDNGDNWRLGFSRKVYGLNGPVNTAGSTVKRIGEDGAEVTYFYNNDSAHPTYTSTRGDGAVDTLTWAASYWMWADGSTQTREIYSVDKGLLLAVMDRNNNTLGITYNGNDLVSSIINGANGEKTTIEYVGSSNDIADILTTYTDNSTGTAVAKSLKRVSYGYDDSHRLTSVTVDLTPDITTDSKIYVTSYTYDEYANQISSIAQTDGSRLDFTYGTSGINTVRDERGRTTTFNYDTANRQTLITDPAGRVMVWSYDTNSQIKSIQQLAGGKSELTQFGYDANGNVTSVIDSLGNTTTYKYDANGNRILERDALGNTVARLYGTRNELQSETTYTNPDPDGEGSQQPSGAQTTYYAYDGNLNLRFTVSPEGRVTEYRYFTSGAGIGLRSQAIVYGDALNPQSALPTLTALSAWTSTSAPTSRDFTRAQLTNYSYDFRGQLSSVTTYTKVDAAGNGVTSDSNFPASITQYIYDQAGQLLKTIDPRSASYTTTYTYDGLIPRFFGGEALRWKPTKNVLPF